MTVFKCCGSVRSCSTEFHPCFVQSCFKCLKQLCNQSSFALRNYFIIQFFTLHALQLGLISILSSIVHSCIAWVLAWPWDCFFFQVLTDITNSQWSYKQDRFCLFPFETVSLPCLLFWLFLPLPWLFKLQAWQNVTEHFLLFSSLIDTHKQSKTKVLAF